MSALSLPSASFARRPGETQRAMKNRLMRENGIKTGRQWVRFRRLHGILTPKKARNR